MSGVEQFGRSAFNDWGHLLKHLRREHRVSKLELQKMHWGFPTNDLTHRNRCLLPSTPHS